MKLFKETRDHFLNPRDAMIDGLVDVDNHMDVDRLLEAYSFGIFPWPQDGVPTLWFSPPERGILDFDKYKPSTKFKKFLKKHSFHLTFNKDFEQVLHSCQKSPRPDQEGTWITDKIAKGYLDFHKAGYAHSVEAWEGDELVGGLYGVYVAGVFCGESMFFKKDNASKVCLDFLIRFLQSQNKAWMDIQMVTPLLESIGAEYISRKEFLRRLELEKKSATKITFVNN